ncbi:MAG TPA: ATP-binding protein [Planctomycetota bacterium]|nr:ATP-binding protein [Planctomycetota bacterium]
MSKMHALLARQIKRYFNGEEELPAEVLPFIAAVDAAYRQLEEDCRMLERSLELSSRELLARNSEMLTMFRAFPDLFFRLDPQGTILDCNANRISDLAAPQESLRGRQIQTAFPEPLGREIENTIRRVAETGQVASLEYPLTVPSGKKYWEARIMRIVGGELLMIVRDITERLEVQEALRHSEEKLRQAQKMDEIGRLAGGIAHDFNNLLTTIIGLSEAALQGLPAGPVVEDLQEIRKTGQRAATLTQQLLAFSRRQVIEPRVLSFSEIIPNIVKMLSRVIGEDIEIATRLESSLGTVRVDPGQMEQLILNLAVNARDAMPKGGTLTIAATNAEIDASFIRSHLGAVAGQYVKLTVGDTGTGMSPEATAHLFEPFFTTKEQGRGTGLGLATCYGIVKQNRGYISVHSEGGRGTTVSVYLPREYGQEAPSRPREEKSTDIPRGSETLLLVEDEGAVRKMAARVLRAQGYTVLEAADGLEGVSVVKADEKRALRLVITDMIMPKAGGRQLADEVMRVRPDIKILFTTGYTDDLAARNGALGPEFMVLHKPFTLQALAQKVRERLDSDR